MTHQVSEVNKSHCPVIVAIETATTFGSIALLSGGQCVAEFSLQSRLTHSKRLLYGLERLLVDAQHSWDDIDAVAVSIGPGSFTGLRIGLSTAKGLAFAANKKLLAVPTLDGLASQVQFSKYQICAVVDARKNELYTAFYRNSETAVLDRISDYMAVNTDRLCSLITEPTILVGDGLHIYGRELKERLEDLAIISSKTIVFPRAAAIGILAKDMWEREEFLDIASAVPVYVRVSDAELNFGKTVKATHF